MKYLAKENTWCNSGEKSYRLTGLTLDEFLSYGPQREPSNVGMPLFRKTKDMMG
ncbi:hypothetical protein LguiA_000032 [Lonicera macranthoides]